LADENVPIEAVKILKRKDIDIVSVIEFSPGLSDREVLNLANKEDRILVTFDKDFGELVVREKAKIKGLILLRFRPKSSQQIARIMWQILTSQIPMENNLLIVKEHTIRVIKLKY
jgi:predicted nuclease of predicted toxin-antitoxin system